MARQPSNAWLRRHPWLAVAAALSAAIVVGGMMHSTRGVLARATASPSRRVAERPVSRRPDIAAVIHEDPANRLFDQASTDEWCNRLSAQVAYEAQPGEAPITPVEQAGAERTRLAGMCAKKLISSDEDILSRMHDAANAGSVEARRHVLEQKLRQDSQDVDALGDDAKPDDVAAIQTYYADDVAALRDMAFQPDAEAARLMAQLEQDGKLVERDPVAAVAWQLFASMSVQKSLPKDEDLLRDPALDDFGEEESAAALSQAKALYSHISPAGRTPHVK